MPITVALPHLISVGQVSGIPRIVPTQSAQEPQLTLNFNLRDDLRLDGFFGGNVPSVSDPSPPSSPTYLPKSFVDPTKVNIVVPTPEYETNPVPSFTSFNPTFIDTLFTVDAPSFIIPTIDLSALTIRVDFTDVDIATPVLPNLDKLQRDFFEMVVDDLFLTHPSGFVFTDYLLLQKRGQPDYLAQYRSTEIVHGNQVINNLLQSSERTQTLEKLTINISQVLSKVKLRLLQKESVTKVVLDFYNKFVESCVSKYNLALAKYEGELSAIILSSELYRAAINRNQEAVRAYSALIDLNKTIVDANERKIAIAKNAIELNSIAIRIYGDQIEMCTKINQLNMVNIQIFKNYLEGYTKLVKAKVESYNQLVIDGNTDVLIERLNETNFITQDLAVFAEKEQANLKKKIEEYKLGGEVLNEKISALNSLILLEEKRIDAERKLLSAKATSATEKTRAKLTSMRLGLIEERARLANLKEVLNVSLTGAKDRANADISAAAYTLGAAIAKGNASSHILNRQVNRAYNLARANLQMAVIETLGASSE